MGRGGGGWGAVRTSGRAANLAPGRRPCGLPVRVRRRRPRPSPTPFGRDSCARPTSGSPQACFFPFFPAYGNAVACAPLGSGVSLTLGVGVGGRGACPSPPGSVGLDKITVTCDKVRRADPPFPAWRLSCLPRLSGTCQLRQARCKLSDRGLGSVVVCNRPSSTWVSAGKVPSPRASCFGFLATHSGLGQSFTLDCSSRCLVTVFEREIRVLTGASKKGPSFLL